MNWLTVILLLIAWPACGQPGRIAAQSVRKSPTVIALPFGDSYTGASGSWYGVGGIWRTNVPGPSGTTLKVYPPAGYTLETLVSGNSYSVIYSNDLIGNYRIGNMLVTGTVDGPGGVSHFVLSGGSGQAGWGTNFTATNWIANSLPQHVTTNTANYFDSANPTNLNLFNGNNWNTNNPLYSLHGVTGMALLPTNGYGIAISPRHLLTANHYGPKSNTMVWVKRDNTRFTNTVVSSRFVTEDIRVTLVQPDLPSGIEPVSIITNDATGYIPELVASNYSTFNIEDHRMMLVAFGLNQFRQVGAFYLADYTAAGVAYYFNWQDLNNYNTSISGYYPDWHYTLISGDSGSPALLPVGTNLTVIGTWYSGADYITSSSVWGNTAAIQAAMDYLSDAASVPRATLTPLDVSGFTSY